VCQQLCEVFTRELHTLVRIENLRSPPLTQRLGQGIATLLNLVNPEQLVLYGPAELVDEPAHGSARCFMTALRRTLSDHAFPAQSIIPKPYAPWIGAQAAAAVALRRLGPSPDAVEIKPAASGTGGASGVTIEG